MDLESDDERAIELSTLTAIFPELALSEKDPFTASLDVPVAPSNPVPVLFTTASGADDITINLDNLNINNGNGPSSNKNIEQLQYLPPLHLKFTLPSGYPSSKAPHVELSASPSWIPSQTLARLKAEAEDLWEQLGHDQVIYSYIDSLIQGSDSAFGLLSDPFSVLELPHSDKIALLDHDIRGRKEAFEKKTYTCGICLEPKSGRVCHEMLDCGHIFCVECLQDFYNNAIKTGDIASVRCVDPECVKKTSSNLSKKGQLKTSITPNELLQIPLEHDVVRRYVMLKHKMRIESDKNTVYCPRSWCSGAARSKKYRKPEGLEVVEADESSDEETDPENTRPTTADFLRICEECHYAFCARCRKGWHGELVICLSPDRQREVTAEEKLSEQYMSLHTTKCPTCSVPAQKAFGCNHMICFQCRTHFCYLCAAWLEPSNPYKHFNQVDTPCYMRLWELEEGDGHDVGTGPAGGEQQ